MCAIEILKKKANSFYCQLHILDGPTAEKLMHNFHTIRAVGDPAPILL